MYKKGRKFSAGILSLNLQECCSCRAYLILLFLSAIKIWLLNYWMIQSWKFNIHQNIFYV